MRTCYWLFTVLIVFAISDSISADVPKLISFQGRLTGIDGTPAPDATYNFTFKFYAVSVGGVSLWNETQAGVSVTGGLYNVLLGTVNPLPAGTFFKQQLYLGVQVGTDPEMASRYQLASSVSVLAVPDTLSPVYLNSVGLIPQATEPATPTAGVLYLDATGNQLKYYDGARWLVLAAGQDGLWKENADFLYPAAQPLNSIKVAKAAWEPYGFFSDMFSDTAEGYGGWFRSVSMPSVLAGINNYGIYGDGSYIGTTNLGMTYGGFFNSFSTAQNNYGVKTYVSHEGSLGYAIGLATEAYMAAGNVNSIGLEGINVWTGRASDEGPNHGAFIHANDGSLVYGIETEVTGARDTAYGYKATMSNSKTTIGGYWGATSDSADLYGLYVNATHNLSLSYPSAISYGGYIKLSANGGGYGLHVTAQQHASSSIYGGLFDVDMDAGTSASSYGVYVTSNRGADDGVNYGGYFLSSSGTRMYGIYATASGQRDSAMAVRGTASGIKSTGGYFYGQTRGVYAKSDSLAGYFELNATGNRDYYGIQVDASNSSAGSHELYGIYASAAASGDMPATGNRGYGSSVGSAATGVEGEGHTVSTGSFAEGGHFTGTVVNGSNTYQAYCYAGQAYSAGTLKKLYGVGDVSEIIPTPNHGRVTLTCPESPEYWYEDFGTAQVVDGRAHVELDPILVEISFIDARNPMRVYTQVTGEDYYPVSVVKGQTGFDIVEANHGRHTFEVDWRVVVKPKTNYGEGRFVQAPGPPFLKGAEIQAAQAANRPPDRVWQWKTDWETYGYDPAEYIPEGCIVPGGPHAGMVKQADGSIVPPAERVPAESAPEELPASR